MIIGYISQIIGPVVDVCFQADATTKDIVLPKIHDALEITHPDGRKIVIEVQQHIGEKTVRCVAMDNTDGLSRGIPAIWRRFPSGRGCCWPALCRWPESPEPSVPAISSFPA